MPVSAPNNLKLAVIFGEGLVKLCYPCTIQAVLRHRTPTPGKRFEHRPSHTGMFQNRRFGTGYRYGERTPRSH